MPDSDVFVINDTLHYLSYEKQENVLKNCLQHLNNNGFLIVRDSDTSNVKRHKKTLITEKFSVNIFKFNKAIEQLNFFSSSMLERMVNKFGYTITKKENDKHSSNTIYVIAKK